VKSRVTWKANVLLDRGNALEGMINFMSIARDILKFLSQIVEREEFSGTRARTRARESLKSHGRWVANCDSLCARAPIRLDHVTLRSGAAALTVATNAFWVPFRPKASSASQRG
jgi:hypothetical protein